MLDGDAFGASIVIVDGIAASRFLLDALFVNLLLGIGDVLPELVRCLDGS